MTNTNAKGEHMTAMNKLKVNISNKQKDIKIPSGMRLLVRRCCNATLVEENFEGNAEVSVTFVNNSQIQGLNKQYRNIDSATDVLSFPMGEHGKFDIDPDTDAFVLGDIVISLERAGEQAKSYNHSLQREVAFLTIHSMLHILGYDHVNGGIEAMKMREREAKILAELGLEQNVFDEE